MKHNSGSHIEVSVVCDLYSMQNFKKTEVQINHIIQSSANARHGNFLQHRVDTASFIYAACTHVQTFIYQALYRWSNLVRKTSHCRKLQCHRWYKQNLIWK